MNSFFERKIRALLDKAESIMNNSKNASKDKKDCDAIIDQIDQILSENIGSFPSDFSLETMIRLPEIILNFGSKKRLAEKYLKIFLRNVESEGLYNVKVHVLYAQMLSQKANEERFESAIKIDLVRDAVVHLTHAIKTVINPQSYQRYSFMAYNISKVVYQMVRMFFRPTHLQEFAEIVKLVRQALVAQVDCEYDWNGFFSWLLFYCLEDCKGDKNEANQILEKLWENSKVQKYFFHQDLFRIRIANSSGNPQLISALTKEADKDPSGELKVLLVLQSISSKIIPDNQIEKELNSLMRIVMPNRNDNPEITDTQLMTESLSEIAHVAALNGITTLAHIILEHLKKKPTLSSKAYIMIEFTKAETTLRSKNDESKISKEQTEAEQKLEFEIRKRREALHIITKAIKSRLIFLNPYYLYEGCVKIWNISLPFLNEKHKSENIKSFTIASKVLKEIQSSDFHLRICLHFELSKIHLENSNVQMAEENILECQKLLNFYEGYFEKEKIEELQNKINLILRPVELDKRTTLDVINDKINSFKSGNFENSLTFFEEIVRMLSEFKTDDIDTIQNYFYYLDVYVDPEQIKHMTDDEQMQYRIKLLKKVSYKALLKKCYLYEESCKLAFEKGSNDDCLELSNSLINELKRLSDKNKSHLTNDRTDAIQVDIKNINSSDIAIDPETDQTIQIHLVRVLLLKSQSIIKKMTEECVEFALEDVVSTNTNQTIAVNLHEGYNKMKDEIIEGFIKSVQIALKFKQTWLIFNAGIIIWNTYLLAFRSVNNKQKPHPMTILLLDTYFNALKTAIGIIEQRKVLDFDFDNKVQVYGNISIIYTRMLEQNGDYQKAYSITEELLLVFLTPQTRKIVNSIRSRVGVLLKPDKSGKKPITSLANQTDQAVFEINSKLEIIGNSFNTNVRQEDRLQAIKDCYELLSEFHEKKIDNVDREILSELWTKLANLAVNEEKTEYTKLALSSLEKVLEKQETETRTGSSKYIALAKFLYAKALCNLIEVSGIVKEQHEMILLKSLQLLLESIEVSIKNKNSKIFEQIKQFYLIIKVISEQLYTPENRRCIIKPIFSLVYYIKIAKEMFDNFTKDIELSQILLNMCIFVTRGCLDKQDWELALMAVNLLLEICHASLKDRVWVLKVIALTKQNNDVESIFEEIKSCSVTLQCTLLQEIAWNAESPQQQYKAFTRAIDIVKKENSPRIFEVILNFKEWMFRNDFPVENIKESIQFLERIVHQKSFERSFNQTHQNIENGQLNHQLHSLNKINQNNENVQPNNQLKSSNQISVNNVDKTTDMQNVKINEVSDYFGSSKSSFENSKLLYGWVNYGIEDCDNLFKVYMISSMLAQNLQEKMSFLGNAVFFLWKALSLTIQQMSSENGEGLSNADPKTSDDWIELKIPQSFIESISRTNSKIKFCKKAFKQPLVTFHYLLSISESMRDYGSPIQMSIVVKYIELFSSSILESQLACQISTLLTAQYYHYFNKRNLSDNAVKTFLSVIPLTQEYFLNEIEIFSKTYSDKFFKNFELNSIISKTKKTQYLNIIYPFEFWISFAEILLSIHQTQLVKIILPHAIKCCLKASASELLGKCQVLLAIVLSREGESKPAQLLFESAGKNLKLLKNWKLFIANTTDHFISQNDLSNPSQVVDKFEILLQGLLSKDNFKYNIFLGKDILGYIQLIKANLNIEEFISFDKHSIAENEEYYCDNMLKVFWETLVLIQSFLDISDEGLLPSNFQYIIVILNKIVKLLDYIKLLNYDFMNQAYIFCGLLLSLYEKLEDHCNFIKKYLVDNCDSFILNPTRDIDSHLISKLKIDSKNQSVLNQNDSKNQSVLNQNEIHKDSSNKALIKSSDCLLNELLSQLSFIHIQTTNIFLKLELVYRDNDYSFPAVQEKYLGEKYLGSFKKLKLVENFESSEENIVGDYIDVFEYKLNQNMRRSWALVVNNLQRIDKLVHDSKTQSFNLRIALELDKTMVFKREYLNELELKKKKIVDFFKIEKSSQEVIDESNMIKSQKEKETVDYSFFMNDCYYDYNIHSHLLKLDSKEQMSDGLKLKNLVEYQAFLGQNKQNQFYFENLSKSNSTGTKLKEIRLKQNNVELKKLIEETPEFKLFFNYKSFEQCIPLLPKNSFYIIIEPSANCTKLLFGLIYLGEDESSNHFVFKSPKNSFITIMAMRKYICKYDLLYSSCQNQPNGDELLNDQIRNEMNLVIHNFVDYFTEFDNALKLVTEKLNQSQSNKSKTDKKKNTEGGNKFNGLFFISNVDFIQLPFSKLFEQWRSDFMFYSYDFSLYNLTKKSTNENSVKPSTITPNDTFYITNELFIDKTMVSDQSLNSPKEFTSSKNNKNQLDKNDKSQIDKKPSEKNEKVLRSDGFDEISNTNINLMIILNSLSSEGYDYKEYIPNISEIQKKFQTKKCLIFKNSRSFEQTLSFEDLVSISGVCKIELIVIMDNLKYSMLDQKSNDYNDEESQYVNRKNLILLMSILGVKCCVLCKDYLLFDKCKTLIESLKTISDNEAELGSLLNNDQLKHSFEFFGNPSIVLQNGIKSNKK